MNAQKAVEIEYNTFDGRRVKAEFRTIPVPHFYVTDCETGKLLLSPIRSLVEWKAFVWNLQNDPPAEFEIVR